MNEAVITRGLVKRYGRHRALDGFTLAVPAGSITGLVGRNGAGKTTWMMTVAGFVLPDAGEVNILGSGPFDARRHGGRFTILPQTPVKYARLSHTVIPTIFLCASNSRLPR